MILRREDWKGLMRNSRLPQVKGPMYHCLANSLCTMVSKMLQCTTIEGLLGGVKEWDMLGASTWKPWINWSTRVGNLCVMFKVIHSSCQLSVT